LPEAQDALAQADPQALRPPMEGYRSQLLASHDGGIAPRWIMISSARRRPQAQRTVDKPWLKPSTTEAKAFQQRGRPGQTTPPNPLVYQIAGAMPSSWAIRHALVAQQSWVMLAPHDLDRPTLAPLELLAGYTGPKHAERGFRLLKAPRFRASSRALKKPQRSMALLRVMTVCLRGDAALEYRLRNALKAPQTTVPTQQGQPGQNPTARWVFQYCVSIPLLHMPGAGAFVLKLNDQHRPLRRIVGRRYEVVSS